MTTTDRTPAEKSLDDQNELISVLEKADDIMRRKQNRAATASMNILRRLIMAEKKRLEIIRKGLAREQDR